MEQRTKNKEQRIKNKEAVISVQCTGYLDFRIFRLPDVRIFECLKILLNQSLITNRFLLSSDSVLPFPIEMPLAELSAFSFELLFLSRVLN